MQQATHSSTAAKAEADRKAAQKRHDTRRKRLEEMTAKANAKAKLEADNKAKLEADKKTKAAEKKTKEKEKRQTSAEALVEDEQKETDASKETSDSESSSNTEATKGKRKKKGEKCAVGTSWHKWCSPKFRRRDWQ